MEYDKPKMLGVRVNVSLSFTIDKQRHWLTESSKNFVNSQFFGNIRNSDTIPSIKEKKQTHNYSCICIILVLCNVLFMIDGDDIKIRMAASMMYSGMQYYSHDG